MLLVMIMALSSASSFAATTKCIPVEKGMKIPFTFKKGSVSKGGIELDSKEQNFVMEKDSKLPVSFKRTQATPGYIEMSLDQASGKATGELELRYELTDKIIAEKPGACVVSFSMKSAFESHPVENCAECAAKGAKEGEFHITDIVLNLSDGTNYSFRMFKF